MRNLTAWRQWSAIASKFPCPQCGVRDLLNPLPPPGQRLEGIPKYCVSWTTLPLRNSIILTVYASRPWYVIVYSVIQDPRFRNPLDLEA